MKVLVVGASGATGRQLVDQLLIQGNEVKVMVRSTHNLPETWKENTKVQIITASILELSDKEMGIHVSDCEAVASCLGHNLNWKGIYGKPRRLVTDAARRLCSAIKTNGLNHPVKYVLMNTSGNQNRDLDEPISFAQKCVIGLLRLALPPHVDNEKAADHLRTKIGQNDKHIEWVAVRPDGLINENDVTEYEVYPSPIRSAIFNAGKVSRINVAHFMSALLNDENLWNKWKGQMPVIYSKTE
ncbi:MAG: NAD-dependent epimerase [Muricauda sp.]|nr:NAD(P)-binding oxidoreductase [Allomuricauda sp.]MBC31486.1 NAD-dependent epimerase [Allomuricauda sp.]|tara:strand:+ start:468 stop:1193 length:726 start_codon:yes stop_codon:yes gene_type:complete